MGSAPARSLSTSCHSVIGVHFRLVCQVSLLRWPSRGPGACEEERFGGQEKLLQGMMLKEKPSMEVGASCVAEGPREYVCHALSSRAETHLGIGEVLGL